MNIPSVESAGLLILWSMYGLAKPTPFQPGISETGESVLRIISGVGLFPPIMTWTEFWLPLKIVLDMPSAVKFTVTRMSVSPGHS